MALRDNIRIMVVDDMSTSRGLITQALDDAGVRNYDTCNDGQTAFQRVTANPVNLVISDYNMPKMDGLQLLQALRQQTSTRAVGFVLVTGTADPRVIEFGRQWGLNNFLKKPFTPQSFKACIEAVVGRL